jgi:hypothetical protein
VLALGGCANEPVAAPFSTQMSHLGAVVLAPRDLSGVTNAEAAEPKKSVASKVLSARAFERVTGFKTDPARLLETD